MLSGPENMPVFGDNQLTPEEKRSIINYIQTIKDMPDPGGAGIGRIGPVGRGPGHLARRDERPDVRDLLDGDQGVTTHDTRPGSTGGADIPGPLHGGPDDDYTPEQLAAMPREELDRLGAAYDGVQILHVDPGPEPGSALERRYVRQVGAVFALAGLAAFAFVVVYVGSGWFLPEWEWTIDSGTWSTLFTPDARRRSWAWRSPSSASGSCSTPASCCRTRRRCRTSTTAPTSTASPPARPWSAACTTAAWPGASSSPARSPSWAAASA